MRLDVDYLGWWGLRFCVCWEDGCGSMRVRGWKLRLYDIYGGDWMEAFRLNIDYSGDGEWELKICVVYWVFD